MACYDFDTELSKSNLDNEFYFKCLPHLRKVQDASPEQQKKGIDKVLILKTGGELFVEEKRRKRFYKDIALEIMSGKNRGWLYTTQAHLIRIHIVETNMDYLIPVLALQLAWHANKDKWLAENFRTHAGTTRGNMAWQSECVCVTASALFHEMQAQWDKVQVTTGVK